MLIFVITILVELQKSTEFISSPLIDSGNSNLLIFRKEELEETTGTYTISYEDLTGSTVVPVGPLMSMESLLIDNTSALTNLDSKLDFSTNSLNTVSGVTTLNSTQVLNSNANRRYLIVQNVSDTDIWLNFTDVATIGAGSIKLIPNGHYELSTAAGGYMTIEPLNIICSIAGKEFTIKEA